MYEENIRKTLWEYFHRTVEVTYWKSRTFFRDIFRFCKFDFESFFPKYVKFILNPDF